MLRLFAWCVVGYLLGMYFSPLIYPDLRLTEWSNIWTWAWIVLWPLGLVWRFCLMLGNAIWTIAIVVAAIAVGTVGIGSVGNMFADRTAKRRIREENTQRKVQQFAKDFQRRQREDGKND